MNGTVLSSSSSAMTAAMLFAGSPSAWTNAGTGSKSSFWAGAASSVMRPANLAAPGCPGKLESLGDRSHYVRGLRHPARRVAELFREGGRHLGLERVGVDV